jgi:hypothetical protein
MSSSAFASVSLGESPWTPCWTVRPPMDDYRSCRAREMGKSNEGGNLREGWAGG